MRRDLEAQREFVEFIWDGQEGLFEVAELPSKRIVTSRHEALDRLPQMQFFGLLARSREGSTKDDVSPNGNVLWADIDDRQALDRIDERLSQRGLKPSAILDSGHKGYWVYFKLRTPLPKAAIETYNRSLASFLDADHSWNCNRIGRLPEVERRESGKFSRLVDFTAERHEVKEFTFLQEIALHHHSAPITEALPPLSGLPVPVPIPVLGPELREYVRVCPIKGASYDRSQMEQGIFTALAGQSWTDAQIVTYANNNRLPRHLEEYQQHGDYRWTVRSIAKARNYLQSQQSSIVIPSMCKESQTSLRHVNRREALKLVRGQTTADYRELLQQRFGCKRATSFTIVKQFLDQGYVRKTGRGGTLVLTRKGMRLFEGRYRRALVLPKIRKSGLSVW